MSALAGATIVLTRTPEDAAAWAAPLQAAGARVTNLPCIRTEPIDDARTRRELAAALATADWLILTSRRGVAALTAMLPAGTVRASTRIAVVGAATAAAAEAAFGRVDLVSAGGTARSLAAGLVADGRAEPGTRFVAALAANAGNVLEQTLAAAGAHCERIDIYRTIAHPPVARRRPLASLGADAIIFSSPSTVEGFLNQIERDDRCPAYSIGPSTSAALRGAGLDVAGEAPEPSIDALITVIASSLAAPANAAGGRKS
jgi:uroporphyrinogen-III synthase